MDQGQFSSLMRYQNKQVPCEIPQPLGEQFIYSISVPVSNYNNIEFKKQFERRLIELRKKNTQDTPSENKQDIFTKVAQNKSKQNVHDRLYSMGRQKQQILDKRRLQNARSQPQLALQNNQTRQQTKVEDRLLNAGKQQKMRQEVRIQKEILAQKQQSHPHISEQAKLLQRKVPITERLYTMHAIQNKKRENLQQKLEPECTFKPAINSNWSKEYMNFDDISEIGFDQDRPKVQKQELRRLSPAPLNIVSPSHCFEKSVTNITIDNNSEKSYRAPSVPPFTPKINERSRILARKRESNSVSRMSTMSEQNFSFQPQINANSRLMSPSTGKRWNELYQQNFSRREKLEQLRQEFMQIKNSTIECTFTPQTVSKRPETSIQDLPTRLNLWNQTKEMNIEMMKRCQTDPDLLECTFKPQITEYQGPIYQMVRQKQQVKGGYSKKIQPEMLADPKEY